LGANAFTWEPVRTLSENELLSTYFEFRVELLQRNMQKLREINEAVSNPSDTQFGKYLTSSQIKSLIGQPKNILEKIVSYLQAETCNFCPITARVGVHGDYIFVETCAKRVECLFNVKLVEYLNNKGGKVLRSSHISNPSDLHDLRVPAEIQPFITRIMHIVDLPIELRYQGRIQDDPSAFPGLNIDPNLIRLNYGIDGYANLPSTGPQSSQACGEFQRNFWRPVDLTDAQAHWNLPINNVTNIIGDDNWSSSLSSLDEASLDFQYITTVTDLETWAFIQAGEGFDLIAYCQTVLDTPNAPYVHSLSYGGTETDFDSDTLQRTNDEFMKFTSQGFTLVAASGDSGTASTNTFSCPAFDPLFPATSPYVTAVGATYLLAGDDAPQCAVSFSGSGFSNNFVRPSWQDAAVSGYLNGGVQLPGSYLFNASGRAIPDMAAYGTNFLVNIRGKYLQVAGTSASCPVVAAMVAYGNALREQTGIPPLGNINPRLYSAGAVGTDITCGESQARQCDQGFYAYSGWDPATGLGTPIGKTFFAILD
jgi:tripeptidyl-peptidase-1